MKWFLILNLIYVNALQFDSKKPCNESLPLHATRLNYTSQSCTFQCSNACNTCPPLPFLEEYYVKEDCTKTRCKKGFFWKAPNCEMCLPNHYCPATDLKVGNPPMCLNNCTSLPGSSSILDCRALPTSDVRVYSLNYLIYVPSNSIQNIRVPPICYDIDNILYINLEYGLFFKCVFQKTPVPVIFQTICYVGLQSCSNEKEYENYLTGKLETLKSQMESGILKCIAGSYVNEIEIKRPYFLVDRILSSQAIINETFENKNAIHLESPTNSPDVSNGHLEWYENNTLFMEGFRFFYIIIFFLILCILLLCSTCYMQIKRKQNIQSIYKKIEKNHKILNTFKVYIKKLKKIIKY